MMGSVAYLKDRLVNLVSQLGVGTRDKAANNVWTLVPKSQNELEAAYRGNWINRKIIDIPPFDSVRAWRNWQAEDDQIEAIEKVEAQFRLRHKVMTAQRWARLYGGAAIVIGMDDGRPDQPLDVERVGKDSLKYLHVLSRHEVAHGQPVQNVLDSSFGEPEYWEITGQDGIQVRIHPTRLVRFIGADVPRMQTLTQEWPWGDSVLQVIGEAIEQAESAIANSASLVHEANVDVIRIPDFMNNLATAGYTTQLTNRFALAAATKGNNGMLLLDKEEEYDRKEITFTQLPELIKVYLQVASGAADIPATRLLGQAPIGMNATGESDIRNYYDRISADQHLVLTPALEPLDEVVIRSALGSRDESIYYTWAPLWQLDAVQLADIMKKKAEASQIYVNSALVPTDALATAVTNMLIEDGSYPGLEAALEEAEQEPAEFALGEQKAAAEAEQASFEAVAANENKALEKAAADSRHARMIKDARPRSLYVCRKVLNADAIKAWAREQGFTTSLSADDMHVTIAYSKTAVDWMKVGPDYASDKDGKFVVSPGGPRVVEPLGPNGAVVLFFSASQLAWRHQEIINVGASWDYDSYQPHITITYRMPEGMDFNVIEPYRGPIVLGPEIFEEVKDEGSVRASYEEDAEGQPRNLAGSPNGPGGHFRSQYGRMRPDPDDGDDELEEEAE